MRLAQYFRWSLWLLALLFVDNKATTNEYVAKYALAFSTDHQQDSYQFPLFFEEEQEDNDDKEPQLTAFTAANNVFFQQIIHTFDTKSLFLETSPACLSLKKRLFILYHSLKIPF